MSGKNFYTPMIVSFVHLAHAVMGPLIGSLRIENRDGIFVHRTRALYDGLSVLVDEARDLPDTEQADLDFHNSSFPKLRKVAQELNEIVEELIQTESTSECVRDAACDVKKFLLDSLILNDSPTWYRGGTSFACFKECQMRVTLDSQGALGIVTRILYHFPCWVGVLEPAQTFEDWEEKILTELKTEDLNIQVEDLVTGEIWSGRLSDLALPEPDYPWYELQWRDNKKL